MFERSEFKNFREANSMEQREKEKQGRFSFGYFSLAKQRKVTIIGETPMQSKINA